MRLVSGFVLAAIFAVVPAFGQDDLSLQTSVNRVLYGGPLKDVHASVRGGTVTLTGSVALFGSKLQAEVNVSRIHGVNAIRDEVRVAGPAVEDGALQSRLRNLIAYQTYQRTRELPVNSQVISVSVRNGVVTLEAHNADPIFASVAFQTAESTPGVQGVVNRIQTKAGSVAASDRQGTLAGGSTGLSTLP